MSDERDFQTLSDRNLEEDYFYQKDRDLIETRRRELDRKRVEREQEEARQRYWMVCPKCGGQMEEVKRGMVAIDVCGGCSGVFLDAGELELIQQMEKKESFFNSMGRVLERAFKGDQRKD